jgi:hypothetical protein
MAAGAADVARSRAHHAGSSPLLEAGETPRSTTVTEMPSGASSPRRDPLRPSIADLAAE